jgi:hypothetical protein
MFAAVQPGNSVTISEFIADNNHDGTAELFASLLDGVIDTLEPSEGATVQVREHCGLCGQICTVWRSSPVIPRVLNGLAILPTLVTKA